MAIRQHNGKVGALSNQETWPSETSSPRLIVASDSQPPPTSRKRKRSIFSSKQRNTQAELSNLSEPQVKRQRVPSNTSSNSSTNSSTDSSWSNWDRAEREYWDSLSKLWLTPNALRELNRRNALLQSETPPYQETSVTREQHPADIIRFARHGGPNLSGIRNYPDLESVSFTPDLESVSSTPDPMPQTGKSKAKLGQKTHSDVEKRKKRSSAYDGNFEQHLVDNNVFPASRAHRATNHAEWHEVLIRPRASPSRSSDASYNSFVNAVEGVRDESEAMTKAFPKIVGNSRYASGQNVSFGHLKKITKKTVVPQPDFYQGEFPGEGNRTLRKRLSRAIVPSRRKDRAFLPTYFAEAKGPEGSFAVARRQACHDGALGARAMHQVENLGRRGETFDNKARTASAVYFGEGNLNLFTHHVSQSRGPGTPIQTYMTPLRSYSLIDSPDTFRQGVRAFRNASDYTHQLRKDSIEAAHRRNGIVTPPPPTIARRSTRRPLACQQPRDETSDSETSSSSDEESDDGNYKSSSTARLKRKAPNAKVVTATPKRLARRDPSPPRRELRPRRGNGRA